MKSSIEKSFNKNFKSKFWTVSLLLVTGCWLLVTDTFAASVVQRPATANTAAAASQNRLAATSVRPSLRGASVSVSVPVAEPEVVEEIVEEIEIVQPITAKDNQFTNIFETSATTSSDDELAARIRAQRDAIAAADIAATAVSSNAATLAAGSNACDTALRSCIAAECGNDFSRCAGDTDTVWGGKMESCRRKTNCTGAEFTAIAAEVKADRDTNAILSSFNETMLCGENYNKCIQASCGTNYNGCLSKAGGDAAVANCSRAFDACRTSDSGLQARAMELFATLRTGAERDIVVAEKRLYEIRDLMSAECRRMGAAFDERSLECVYTVNFAADNDGELTTFASRKLAAGSEFMCTPEWFGIDITTFKENAYRYTRAQKGASSAALGAGAGLAAGAVASGAIDRAIDRHKADQAVKTEENKPVQKETAPKNTEPKFDFNAKDEIERMSNKFDERYGNESNDDGPVTPAPYDPPAYVESDEESTWVAPDAVSNDSSSSDSNGSNGASKQATRTGME